MIVMPANNTGIVVGWLAGRFPGRIGHLHSPRPGRDCPPLFDFMPFALDNGRFPVWSSGGEWSESDYLKLLDDVRDAGGKPRWILVPDVVADHYGTLREWDRWCPRLLQYGWPLAFAVQDGMTEADVPDEAAVVFVGGSTRWKRRTLHDWCDNHPRVHVGRINTDKWLWVAQEAGAESVDGTGYLRGDQRQLAGLVTFLERSTAGLGNNLGRSMFEMLRDTGRLP